MSGASRGKRFAAFAVDVLFCMGIGLIPVAGRVLALLYVLFRDGLHLEGLRGQSLGKSFLRLKVVSYEGGQDRNDWTDSVKRNFILLIPLLGVLVEAIFVLVDRDGRRLGDRIAGTWVVEDAPSPKPEPLESRLRPTPEPPAPTM